MDFKKFSEKNNLITLYNKKEDITIVSTPDDIEIQMHILDDLWNSYNDIDNYEMEYFEE